MEELIDTVLRDPHHDREAITASGLLADIVSKLRDKIFSLEDANQLSPSRTLIHCLKIAFDGELIVDLNSLTHIASDLLVEAASNAVLGGMDLDMILNEECGWETLYIMMMPSISPKCVAALWAKNTSFKELYHTDLFKLPLMQAYCYSALIKGLESPYDRYPQSYQEKYCSPVSVRSQKYQGEPNLHKADGITVDLQS